MRLPFLNAGLAAPEVRTACELGFGQGVSTNIHAACSTTQWWGTDFNPAQAAFAREVGAVSKADVRLYDEAFAEFCQRGDLPEFDFVGLHGIWSWISEQNRAVIVDFIRRKLKVGGVLYISYNTMPGWAAMVPLRQLLTEHAEVMAAPGRGTVARIDAALEFADKLLATNPLAARAQPQIADRIKLLKGQNRHYLAHEYFNRDWQPMPIAEMGRWLGDAKMSYACSAHYLDLVDAINLSPKSPMQCSARRRGTSW
jgi:SAM-dependent methyltransferase